MRAVLEVELEGPWLDASLDGLAGTVPRAVVHGRREVELERLRELATDVARILNRGSRWNDRDQGSRELLARKGAALFDALLPASVKAALRAASGGELVVRARGELAFVPWELLHTGFGFMGLLFALGRDVAARERPRDAGAPWRMLVIADPRGDLIGSYYEGLTLRDELAAAGHVEVDLRSSEVGTEDVRQLLRDYDVVHYAGHAEPSGPGRERGWWLRDGVLAPSAIRELGGGPAFPRLVFANACRSARVEPGEVGVAPSLTEAFIEAGADHVIGTVWDVPDEPASGFALAFYAQLLAGHPIGEAIRRARVTLAARYGEDSIYWAAWVLHGDPAPSCFGVAQPARVDEVAKIGAQQAELRSVAARVRGAAVGGAPRVVSLEAPRGAWLRVAAGVAALAAIVGLAGALGQNGAVIVARPARTADLGPIERLTPMPLELASSPAPPALPTQPKDVGAVGEAQLSIIGEVGGEPVETTSLASGQSFRIRWQVPRAGYASVWQVESQGGVRRIFPTRGLGPDEAGASVVAAAPGGRSVELPGAGRWFFLDDRKGTEHFFLAWRSQAPGDDAALAAEIEAEVTALAPRGAARLELRGTGGIKGAPSAATTTAIAERFREVLEDRFEVVRTLEVEHH